MAELRSDRQLSDCATVESERRAKGGKGIGVYGHCGLVIFGKHSALGGARGRRQVR